MMIDLRAAAAALLLCSAVTPACAMTITCDPSASGGPAVSMVGDINVDKERGGDFADAASLKAEFQRCFAGYPGQRRIRLHSGGGSVDASLAMSEFLVEQPNVATSVVASFTNEQGVQEPGYCISACTYLFIAGASRDVPVGASFEPHGFSSWRNYRTPLLAFVCERQLSPSPQATLAPLYEKARVAWVRTEFCEAFQTYVTAIRAAAQSPNLDADKILSALIDLSTEGKTGLTPIGQAIADIQRQALTPPRRKMLKSMRDTLASAMSELQRETALYSYRQARLNRANDSAFADKAVARYGRDWIATGLDRAIKQFHVDVQNKAANDAETWSNAGQTIGELIRKEVVDSDKTIRNGLMVYLSNRHRSNRDMGLDDDKLMSLMFSTSIIYMRPLSRDELCDLNVVTRGCD